MLITRFGDFSSDGLLVFPQFHIFLLFIDLQKDGGQREDRTSTYSVFLVLILNYTSLNSWDISEDEKIQSIARFHRFVDKTKEVLFYQYSLSSLTLDGTRLGMTEKATGTNRGCLLVELNWQSDGLSCSLIVSN